MPTTRFCLLMGVPERTWRRHQARVRNGRQSKRPWPRPARDKTRETARRHALAHPAWGHRKVGDVSPRRPAVSAATVLRLLREEGLLLEANYQWERRQLAARRKAAFAVEPAGANQVLQMDCTEFETTSGGTWRLPAAGTTGRSMSWAGTSPRPRTARRDHRGMAGFTHASLSRGVTFSDRWTG
jgi:hypothetical protein